MEINFCSKRIRDLFNQLNLLCMCTNFSLSLSLSLSLILSDSLA